MKNVWVLQTAFLGDCVLSLPFLARLLETAPEAHVSVICSRSGEAAFRLALRKGLAPAAARVSVHLFDKRGTHRGPLGMWRFQRELVALHGPPDFVFCLQRSLRSGLLAWLAKAPRRVGFSTGAASFLYTDSVARAWVNGRSEVEKNLDLLRAVSVGDIPVWDPDHAPSLLGHRREIPNAPILLSLGSPWATKRWPVENAAGFVRGAIDDGLEVRLVGDTAARPLAFELKSLVPPSPLLTDLCGQTTIEELVAETESARMVLSGDSALVHIASDLGVPVVALFGPTLPQFGFAPWRRQALALGVGALACRPCGIHGPQRCPLGHHRCLKDLSGESVLRQSRKFLRPRPH